MVELITPAPALATVVKLLTPLLAPVPVTTRMPKTRPPSIVRVDRAGGVMANKVTDRPVLIFECWAPDEPAAEQLADRVRALLKAHRFSSVDGVRLLGWEEAGCAHFDDPDVTTQSRWQITGTLGIAAR
ncbi:hypothetical protein RDE2_07810 [Rhodococcus sp. RDE2]|nr:hypothetical protein RDE2_07810 [Rhodococcus sp. RDE2]